MPKNSKCSQFGFKNESSCKTNLISANTLYYYIYVHKLEKVKGDALHKYTHLCLKRGEKVTRQIKTNITIIRLKIIIFTAEKNAA